MFESKSKISSNFFLKCKTIVRNSCFLPLTLICDNELFSFVLITLKVSLKRHPYPLEPHPDANEMQMKTIKRLIKCRIRNKQCQRIWIRFKRLVCTLSCSLAKSYFSCNCTVRVLDFTSLSFCLTNFHHFTSGLPRM